MHTYSLTDGGLIIKLVSLWPSGRSLLAAGFPECRLGQIKKKPHKFLVRILIRKRASGRFFCYLLFPIACFLYT